MPKYVSQAAIADPSGALGSRFWDTVREFQEAVGNVDLGMSYMLAPKGKAGWLTISSRNERRFRHALMWLRRQGVIDPAERAELRRQVWEED